MLSQNQAQRRQQITNDLTKEINKQHYNLELLFDDEGQPKIALTQQNKGQYQQIISRVYGLLLQQSSIAKLFAEKSQKYQLPSVFKLDFDVDFITQGPIENPMISLSNDSLMMDPKFCDQKTYFAFITTNENARSEIDLNDIELMLLLWELKKQLQKSHDNQQFNIYLYPNKANFVITKEVCEQQIPYFFDDEHFQSFLHQNTCFLNKNQNLQYFESMNDKLGIEPFQIQKTEEINSGAKQVDFEFKDTEVEPFSRGFIDNQKKKLNITDKIMQVKPKKFDYIHSTLCMPAKITDYIQHKIQFPENQLPFCSHCGITIDQDNYDTLFYDTAFKNSYDSLVQMIMLDGSFYPVVFYLPIYYRFIKDEKYNNIFIEYYTDRNPHKYNQSERIYNFYQQGYKLMHYNFSEQVKVEQQKYQEAKNIEEYYKTEKNHPSNSEIATQIPQQPKPVDSTDQIYFNYVEELEDDN